MPAAATADGIGSIAVLAASVAAVFVAPGGLLLLAAGVRVHLAEALAWSFAASLALLTAAFAACLASSSSIAAAPGALVVVTLAAAGAARFASGGRVPDEPPNFDEDDGLPARSLAGSAERPPVPVHDEGPVPATASDSTASCCTQPSSLVVALLALLALACTAAAVAFAPVGSVDRWWYLAYVRGWLEVPVLDLAEPFLGTGRSFARFGVHPWLFGLATCSRLSGVDPIAVYENGAPALVVLASVSAAFAFAREILREAALARLSVLATMLLWSGALVPVLARAGEDKILAASALLPLALAAFLRVLRGAPRALLLLAIAAAATAAVHALDYAFALVVLAPVTALLAIVRPPARKRLLAASAILAVVAIAPAISGLVVRERLHEIGAELSEPDHPVVRVHEARERLVDLGAGGYVVDPRLLLHPLAGLALLGAFVLVRRGASAFTTRDARAFALVATAIPLAIAFVPPLPAAMGALIPPWMVYRVLWTLPLAPLAAVAAYSILRRFEHREAFAAGLLLLLGLPLLAAGTTSRLSEARGRLAAPEADDFRALVAALKALPVDAILAVPPALAERIPAFTGRHVVAALDRSTVVFAGSRPDGEARLRARAAILAGDASAAVLSRGAGVETTHAVYDPAFPVQPRCARDLFRAGRYALCQVETRDRTAFGLESLEPLPPPAAGAVFHIVARGRCVPKGGAGRLDVWSAAPPVTVCIVDVPPAADGLVLRITVRTGRATEELLVAVDDGHRRLDGSARVRGAADAWFALPPLDTTALEVRVASAFLPSSRIERVELVAPLPSAGTGSARTTDPGAATPR